MLCPMALPSCATSFRNLSPSRASPNSHPAISRSTQPSASRKDCGALLPARCLNTKPMSTPSVPNQVLSNESQVILSTQHFILRLSRPKGSELWVIESFAVSVREVPTLQFTEHPQFPS